MKYVSLQHSLVIVLVTVAIIAGASRLEAAPKSGQPAPAFKVTATSGQQLSLESFRGRVLLVDFFATWCQPCRASIPHLIEFSRKYGPQGLQIIGLSADDDGEKVVRVFAEKHHIPYPVALAGDTTLTDFGVRSVPVMIVIDKKGRVAETFRGYSDEVVRRSEQLIVRLLAEK